MSGSGPEPATVLLLDDDVNTLLVLHSLLERTEARVIECADEICAMRCCAEMSPRIDLFVADVVLKTRGRCRPRKMDSRIPTRC